MGTALLALCFCTLSLVLASKDRIAHLMAGREFVGNEWFSFLNSRGIHNHIRIR